MHLTKPLLLLGSMIFTFLLTGCADALTLEEAGAVDPIGFWYGLWHGIILPVSFICSLIWDEYAIYAVYNNGGWYDFGFVIGMICVASCSGPKGQCEPDDEDVKRFKLFWKRCKRKCKKKEGKEAE